MAFLVNVMRRMQHKINDPRISKNQNNYGIDIKSDIPYINDGKPEHLLDVYSPKDAQGKLPVILEVHGGAYVACYKEVNAHHGHYFASKGFRVVNTNYTLCPEADLRTIVQEIFTVSAWIREHSEEYGFDIDHIYLTGDSAGGHMVLLTAAVQGDEELQKYFAPDMPIQPFLAVAATCPMASFADIKHPKTLSMRLMRSMIKDSINDDEYVSKVDYRNYMTKDFPEVFILTTPTDDLLYKHTRTLHQYMQEHHVPHKYKEYTSRANKLGHVFNVLNPDYPESREANDDILAFFSSKA